MKFNNRVNEEVEITDGRKVWLSRSAATVSIIIGFDGEVSMDNCYVLVVKRGEKLDSPNMFCLPCGYLDWDESARDGAARELYEETGLNINELLLQHRSWNKFEDQPWLVISDPTLDARQNINLYFGAVFVFENGLPTPHFKNSYEGEILMVGWQKLTLIDTLEWAFDHRKRIDMFLEQFNKNL